MLNDSQTTSPILEGRGIINTHGNQEEIQVGREVIEDAPCAVATIKNQRSRDTTTALRVGLSFLCEEKVSSSRTKTAVGKRLDISRRRLSQVTPHRQSALNKNVCWPTGNKKDILRERVTAKTYISHAKQLLDKSQTEVYLEFKKKYPEIKIGQRTFEKCKPFFVKAPKEEDRVSCYCRRTHVEARMVFSQCMKFRKSIVDKTSQPLYPVFNHLSDVVQETFCLKQEGKCYEKKCLYRECSECGV